VSDYYLDVITRCADMPLFKAAATSQAAKASQTRGKKSADHRRIVDYLASRADGATDEEIADGLAINPSTVRPRRGELVEDGRVVAAGERKTKSGRRAVVWKARRANDGR
jgi:predicted ArsR family transcriptional regulator